MASVEYYENSDAVNSFRETQWDAYSSCSKRSSLYQTSYVLHEDYFYQFYYGELSKKKQYKGYLLLFL